MSRSQRREVKYVPPSDEDRLSVPALAGGAAAVWLAVSWKDAGRTNSMCVSLNYRVRKTSLGAWGACSLTVPFMTDVKSF